MKITFSLFEVVVLVGVVQGMVTATILLVNKTQTVSKILLSLLLIVFSLLCIRILILTTGLWQTTFLQYFPLPFELATQPLLWLYICSLVRPGFKLKKSYLWHFVPLGVSFIYSVVIYALVANKFPLEKDVIAESLHFNTIKKIEDFLSILSSVMYWFVGFRIILEYRKWGFQNLSNSDFSTLSWLRNVAILMGILIVTLSTDIFLEYFSVGYRGFLHWKVFFIYLATLIYYLGFRGSQIPNGAYSVLSNHHHAEDDFSLHHIKVKVQKLTDEKANELRTAIVHALEQKELYLDPQLSLRKLAEEVQSTSANVSFVINHHLQKSFRDLINEYRVGRVKALLSNEKFREYSIAGIGYESGFNSEPSFHRIFKSVTGMSPKEYQQRHGSLS